MTAPRPDGSQAARSMRLALRDAELAPHEVSYVNAHGSSTPLNDPTETLAVKATFGDHASKLAITANKSMLGHTLGAAGAIEAIATMLALREGCVPPTINLQDPDPAAEGLDLTPNRAQSRDIAVVLSNSFGFGGQNTALILTAPDR